jgi:hypothetical protein
VSRAGYWLEAPAMAPVRADAFVITEYIKIAYYVAKR